MNIQNSVFYVGGSKGGVGKSLFSFALVDYLLNRNVNILLVDTDTDNPDVFKAHKDLALSNLLCRLNSLGSGLINCQKVCKRVLIVCQEVSYEYSLLSFPCPA